MKTSKIILVISILFISQFVYAENFSTKDQTDIEQTITEYVKSVDNGNVDQLSKTVLPLASIVIVNQLTNNVENYSSAQFATLVKNGQKGGWQRNVTIGSVTTDGNIAVAKIDITDLKIKESGFVTLIKDNGTWKIAGQVTTLRLNK
jgi:hypothetical protein